MPFMQIYNAAAHQNINGIPIRLRSLIYSYCDLEVLINTITKISKEEREFVMSQQHIAEHQNRPNRCFNLEINDQMQITFKEIKFCCDICTHSELTLVSLNEKNICWIVDSLLEQLQNKQLSIIVVVSCLLQPDNIRQLFQTQRILNITNITYKFVETHEIIKNSNYNIFFQIMPFLDISQQVTLDLINAPDFNISEEHSYCLRQCRKLVV